MAHPLRSWWGLALLGLSCFCSHGCEAAKPDRALTAPDPERELARDVLLIVMDDVGVDYVGAYGLNPDVPRTPTLDALARVGVRFDHAYGNPACSPTRALAHLGQWGYRTGVGGILGASETYYLPLDDPLPSLLEHASGLFGKWHLGNFVTKGAPAPDAYGYDAYYCTERNLARQETYWSFTKSENGTVVTETTYATTDTVNDAIAWISAQRELGRPWFANVSLHAAHIPLHDPPAHLVGGADPCGEDPRCRFVAMIEAVDAELGRLIDFAGLDRTTVIVLGDNGTADLLQAPFPAGKQKATVYEGGIRVPLIIAGEQVAAPGVDDNLWSVVDLYATIQELCTGGVLVEHDSISMLPSLQGDAPPRRDHVIAEQFAPFGVLGPEDFVHCTRMVRNLRYKLIRDERSDRDELYDLRVDPYEGTDLLARELSAAERDEYDQLVALLLRHTAF